MKKLKATKKITLATLKSFARRNKENLFVKVNSSFDGMTDMVEPVKDEFSKAKLGEPGNYWRTGIKGLYTVGSSRDYFELYDDGKYFGIEVYNSCGESVLAIKKAAA